MPPLVVNVQYIKDLSFEVPNAPEIYATLRSQPAVQINLDVQARALQEGQNVYRGRAGGEGRGARDAEPPERMAPPSRPRAARCSSPSCNMPACSP